MKCDILGLERALFGPQVSEAFKLVRLLDELSTKLRQLHTNFCNILLPEAIRILTGASEAGRQDPMEAVFRLAEAGQPLLAALEARMRTAAEAGAEEELPSGGAAASGPDLVALQLQVRRLRKEWYDLLERMEKEKGKTEGWSPFYGMPVFACTRVISN